MFLSFLLYPLHLWLVNLSVGAALVSLWLELAGRRCDLAWQVNRRLARYAWLSLLAGSALGVLHGAIIWDETWMTKIRIANSRVIFGVVELLTSLVLLIAYDLWLKKKAAPSAIWAVARWLFPFVAGTNLLYHFPILFSVLGNLDLSAYPDGAQMTSAEFRAAMLNGEVISTWIHFAFSSVAVGGIVGLLVALKRNSAPDENARRLRYCRILAWISASATLAQWVAGPLVFAYQRRATQYLLTGGDWILTGWFLQSVLLALLLSVLQVRLTLRPTDVSLAQVVALLQLLVIFAMSLVALVVG